MCFCARSPLFPQDGTHEHARNELGVEQATGDPRTPLIFMRTPKRGQTTSDGRPDVAIEPTAPMPACAGNRREARRGRRNSPVR